MVAFFAAGSTSFKGIAELGIIAGGGILLCAMAQLFVLPAMVRVVDRSGWGQQLPKPVPVYAAIALLMKVPRLMIALAIGLTVFGVFGLRNLWFDYNLLNMQPRGLESVELERKLLTECNQSVWYALSIADSREELLAQKDKFLQLASVERTEEIVSLLPGDHEVKQPMIAGIQNRLASLPERPPLIAVDSIDEFGPRWRKPKSSRRARRKARLRAAAGTVARCAAAAAAAECYAKISQFQQQMAGDLLSRLHALKSVSNPEPPQLTRSAGQPGQPLRRAERQVPAEDLRPRRYLEHGFAAAVCARGARRRSAGTGNPLQAYECSLEMKHSYELATLYSLIVISCVLWFDFRNLKHCAMAAVPQFDGHRSHAWACWAI